MAIPESWEWWEQSYPHPAVRGAGYHAAGAVQSIPRSTGVRPVTANMAIDYVLARDVRRTRHALRELEEKRIAKAQAHHLAFGPNPAQRVPW